MRNTTKGDWHRLHDGETYRSNLSRIFGDKGKKTNGGYVPSDEYDERGNLITKRVDELQIIEAHAEVREPEETLEGGSIVVSDEQQREYELGRLIRYVRQVMVNTDGTIPSKIPQDASKQLGEVILAAARLRARGDFLTDTPVGIAEEVLAMREELLQAGTELVAKHRESCEGSEVDHMIAREQELALSDPPSVALEDVTCAEDLGLPILEWIEQREKYADPRNLKVLRVEACDSGTDGILKLRVTISYRERK